MSDRVTEVGPRGRGPRIQENGRVSRADAIGRYRAFWQRQKEEAEQALAFTDDDLAVYTFLGPWAQRNRQEVTE